ncbi:respiratory nitrate reductase subunit gamma [Chloroflexi bacterium TSY]|nr:respiratory nitrate reductase subunit gamma [Chloroflexi bacterium TSY]
MFALVIGVLIIFVAIIGLLILFWRRVIDGSITVHFRAAEAITANHQLPEEWITEIKRKVDRKTFDLFKRHKRSGIDLVLEKLDKTIQFFEEGSFYADDEAKKLLLEELTDARNRWAQMTWDELLIGQSNIRDLNQ